MPKLTMITRDNNKNLNESSRTLSLPEHIYLIERSTSESLIALISNAESIYNYLNNERRASTVPESPRLETLPDIVNDFTSLVN